MIDLKYIQNSLNTDTSTAFTHFEQRWPIVFNTSKIIHHSLLPALSKEIETARNILIREVKNDLEFMIGVQSYDTQDLKLRIIKHELDCFSDHLTDSGNQKNEFEIYNGLIDAEFNDDDYIPGIVLPVNHIREKIDDLLKQYLIEEITDASYLEIFLSGLSLRAFLCNYQELKNISCSEILGGLFYKLFNRSAFSNKSNFNGDSISEELCTGSETQNLQIDGFYLIILFLTNNPTKPTKPTIMSCEELLNVVVQVKDCFSYISQIQSSNFQAVQETLKDTKRQKLLVTQELQKVKDGRNRGRDSKHKHSRTYRPLIENMTEKMLKSDSGLHPTEIMQDPSIQQIIQDCRNAQKLDGIEDKKLYKDRTFLNWIETIKRSLTP